MKRSKLEEQTAPRLPGPSGPPPCGGAPQAGGEPVPPAYGARGPSGPPGGALRAPTHAQECVRRIMRSDFNCKSANGAFANKLKSILELGTELVNRLGPRPPWGPKGGAPGALRAPPGGRSPPAGPAAPPLGAPQAGGEPPCPQGGRGPGPPSGGGWGGPGPFGPPLPPLGAPQAGGEPPCPQGGRGPLVRTRLRPTWGPRAAPRYTRLACKARC